MRPGADPAGPLEPCGSLFADGFDTPCWVAACRLPVCGLFWGLLSCDAEAGFLTDADFFVFLGGGDVPAGLVDCFCFGCAVFDLPGGGEAKSLAGSFSGARGCAGFEGGEGGWLGSFAAG